MKHPDSNPLLPFGDNAASPEQPLGEHNDHRVQKPKEEKSDPKEYHFPEMSDAEEKELEKFEKYFKNNPPAISASVVSVRNTHPLSEKTKVVIESQGLYYTYRYNGDRFICTNEERDTRTKRIVAKGTKKAIADALKKIADLMREPQEKKIKDPLGWIGKYDNN